MNRKIKFRGLGIDTIEWVYGFVARIQEDDSSYTWIISEDTTRHIRNVKPTVFRIDPTTIGQFTGLHDKNGVEIYEGDILQRDIYWGCKKIREEFVTVIFKKGQFMFFWNEDKAETSLFNLLNGFFVIGNIHQTSELIK